MNTAYVDEEANYCTVCKSCFEEVQKQQDNIDKILKKYIKKR